MQTMHQNQNQNQNQSQIHPALRQTSLSGPTHAQPSLYSDGAAAAYSQIQPSSDPSYQHPYYGQPTDHSSDERSPGPNPADPNDLKRPRACEACRQLKVKCEPDESNPNGSCKRCAKAHRQCVVTVPSRKRQKKTDSRVAELERKIDALTATLAAKDGNAPDPTLDPAIAQHQASQSLATAYGDQWHPHTQQHTPDQPNATPVQTPGGKRKPHDGIEHFTRDLPKASPKRGKSPPPPPPPPVPQFPAAYPEPGQRIESDTIPYIDVVDRNIIDVRTAYRCFDRYNAELSHHLPIVVFPSDQTAELVRRNKPILFLAVLAVASSTIRPDLQSRLINEATRILGDRVVHKGEKSMELLQTIQLMTLFYPPPERHDEMNFHQLVHIAAVMAMDMGMGKRSKKGPYSAKWAPPEKNSKALDPNSVETRRCWLGCYYMCAISAMSSRRPLLVRWSLYADECLHILETAKDALPSDKRICQLVKAQRIGDEIGMEFSMDDPASVLSLNDANTQRHLKALEQKLADWRSLAGDMTKDPIMRHTEAIMNLYMHEIAMHHDHNIDDFRPPYNTAPIENPPDPEWATPAHIESLTECLRSAHAVFEACLSMDISMLRSLPTHYFVRNAYAAVALIKLYSAVAAKGSKFGSVFTMEQLKVDFYLDRVIQLLQRVAEGGMSKVAQKFAVILTTLRTWHLKISETATNESNGDHQSGPANRESQNYNSKSMPAAPDPSHTWSAQDPALMEHTSSNPPPRSGLQMLSDAAMGPSRVVPTTPMAHGQWIPQPQMGHPQGMPGMEHNMGMPGQGYNMLPTAYNAPIDVISMGGFTSDDFMPFGLGNDWTGFGYHQDPGWHFPS